MTKIEDFKKTLENHDIRIHKIETFIKEFGGKGKISGGEGQYSPGLKLKAKIGIPDEKIGEVFDVEATSLTLLRVIGTDIREKTKASALLVCWGYKCLLNTSEVLANEIKRNVQENKIPINNFGTYLNDLIPSRIRRKGKPNSPKTTYKLTVLGESEAKALLKTLFDK